MIFRVNKNKNYTVMSNYHFKEKKMSLKAKGLLSVMLSLPDNWDYSIEGLVKLSSDGETSVRSALKELEKHGYLKRERVYDKRGKICDWDYCVYEMPLQLENQVVENLHVENLQLENLQLENQVVENMSQLNTQQSNTKKEIKKELKNKDKSKTEFLKHSKQDSFNPAYLVELYRKTCTRLPNLRAMSDKRKDAAEKIYKKYGLDVIKEAFQIANDSAFLTGDNDRGWKADFDFIMREDKFIAILEGKYNSKHKKRLNKFGEGENEKCGHDINAKEKLHGRKIF